MKYCTKCGKELVDEAVICIGCGRPLQAHIVADSTEQLLTKLSERIKTNGVIWVVIGAVQIILGVCGLWYALIVGVINLISAIRDIKYSRTVRTQPVGIVRNFEKLTRPIITLVYNVVIGGVIGIAGSIYYFVALRSFVMENKSAFLAIEQTAVQESA